MTEKLMKDVHRTYTTEINDILLSALSYSVCDIWGQDRVSVLLEGHGREALHVDTEVDRTVGWFTSMYPVVLHQKNNWADQVIQTKETLREIPNQGIGYGVLYEVPKLSLTFNYMGEVVGQEEWVPYGTGEGISENNRMPGKLQVNGIVTNGCLTMSFSYDDQWVTEAEAE
ncbi:hypothetical protein HCA53_14745, partial [Listeria innocua]|nr:hypothetical protein [Listeria innocua]